MCACLGHAEAAPGRVGGLVVYCCWHNSVKINRTLHRHRVITLESRPCLKWAGRALERKEGITKWSTVIKKKKKNIYIYIYIRERERERESKCQIPLVVFCGFFCFVSGCCFFGFAHFIFCWLSRRNYLCLIILSALYYYNCGCYLFEWLYQCNICPSSLFPRKLLRFLSLLCILMH